MKLYNFFRSGTSHRLRIALNLKGLPAQYVPVDLRVEAHLKDEFKAVNPQMLVPALEVDGQVLIQSPAIIEWLEETHPSPALLPTGARERAHVRALAALVGCDIHPINNRRILEYLRKTLGADEAAINIWCTTWITVGFDAYEALLAADLQRGRYSFGDTPTVADVYLIPQIESARRFRVDLSRWPLISAVDRACGLAPDGRHFARPARLDGNSPMITLIVFFGLLFAGLPIVGTILAGALTFMLTNDLSVLYDSIPIQLYGALEISSLLAIPLFLLVGEIMNKAGLTQRLIAVAEVLVGSMKGGLAYANLFTNAMAASILGSAVAQIGVMSKVMIPAMERMGYNRAFSGAVTVSAGLLGPIIPPSMLMIIYGVVAVQPITPLFIAGIVPGLLIVVALVIFAHNFFGPDLPAGTRNGRSASLKVLLEGLVPAVIPVVVIVGIMLGVMTPTESGAVAAIISLVLSFIYREIKLSDLSKIFLDVATNTATITGLIAAASVLSWVLAFQGVPDLVVAYMQGLTDSPFVFLLLVIVMMLILGMFLESISVLIVTVPLLMPVVGTLGIDPIHFGVVCTLATVIGLVTPPVGPGLYIAMVQADIRMGPLFKATLPFLAAVVLVLVLIAAVPALSTWLPALMTAK